MDKVNEEYNRLVRHIEGQFRLIAQIFTVSVVASVALFGYTTHVLFGITQSSSQFEPFMMLIPLAIVFPCALLVFALRREIFKWSGYIKIYLNDGKRWRYETELGKYKQRFPEEESFDAIAITYFSLTGLCSILCWLGIKQASMSVFLELVPLIPMGLLFWWWIYYRDIPKHYSEKCEERWGQIKGTQAANQQIARSKNNNDGLYKKIERLFKGNQKFQSLQSSACLSLTIAVALWGLAYVIGDLRMQLLASAGLLWVISLGIFICLLVRSLSTKQ